MRVDLRIWSMVQIWLIGMKFERQAWILKNYYVTFTTFLSNSDGFAFTTLVWIWMLIMKLLERDILQFHVTMQKENYMAVTDE